MTKRMFLLASGILLAIAIAPFAWGAGEGKPILGGKRNPGSNTSQAYTSETQIIANSSTYGTRQSNKSSNGGGAIYGCRSGAGGTVAKNEPCIRASNLASGFAFEFDTKGTQTGLINAGSGGDTKKPFVTNATGVATGLNADRVDSKSASEIVADATAASNEARPFAQVGGGGAAGTTRGLPANGVSRQGTGDYDVVFGGDRSACAVAATVVGTAAGQIVASPSVAADKSTTTLDVHTFDGGGVAADRAFHVSLDC
jgi:hypothetical protein